MYLRELTIEELTIIYQTYMTEDFPADELKPLARITDMMETGLSRAFGLYEKHELRAYAVFIVPNGLCYGLLDYFAVVKQYRGTGVGHKFFKLIGAALMEKYPRLEGFFIESENVDFVENEKEREIRQRRISFYESNGCQVTPLGSRLFGVTYSILFYAFSLITLQKEAAHEALDQIYIAMFKKHHYENKVRLWIEKP